jgi:isoleucyl-tRNA synthetase
LASEGEWEALRSLREAVNAQLEPMRANKTIGSTAEASVRLGVRSDHRDWLDSYQAELPGFLLVAEVILEHDPALDARPTRTDAPAAAFRVVAHPADTNRFRKCDRCWTHRADVGEAGLCARCAAVLVSTGRSAGA